MTTLTPMEAAAADLRRVKPTPADQRHNQDIDVMQVWRDDIEHTIRCQGWDANQAAVFRALCAQND